MSTVKTVTTREAQHHFSKVMEMVEAGEEIIITRRGKKVAQLKSYKDDADFEG
ncbi:MAG: type II toxin-antitoxin system prevent-host-death family antitoxin [Akkermansiaceae bacterium]|nr:type II toxin-antitoxin system prevent-host-death family antitoxin [Akkermansiaceae bacterium]